MARLIELRLSRFMFVMASFLLPVIHPRAATVDHEKLIQLVARAQDMQDRLVRMVMPDASQNTGSARAEMDQWSRDEMQFQKDLDALSQASLPVESMDGQRLALGYLAAWQYRSWEGFNKIRECKMRTGLEEIATSGKIIQRARMASNEDFDIDWDYGEIRDETQKC